YLNPNADAFQMGLNTEIYVDKSLILSELNKLVSSQGNFVCLSRPRRFGKSMAGNMISAYYSKGCDTREVFSQMKLGQEPNYDKYLNKFNVIKLDLNGWYQNAIVENSVASLIEEINKSLLVDFRKQFPEIEFEEKSSLARCIKEVYVETGEKFVIIIDEYDVLIREQVPQSLFDSYLSFLNGLFKDTAIRPAIALAYITGIIPIVRDKVQSKLNEFTEYTMLDAAQFAPHVGFTAEETKALCEQYGCDFAEFERWYDGYRLSDEVSLFNPKSVTSSISRKRMGSYWSATGSFEALKDYILMDFEGIRQDVITMISGDSVEVDVGSFLNTLDKFESKDDVFTYLIHLGYLNYNFEEQTCCIPNEEVRQEWVRSVKLSPDYKKLMEIINASKKLLDATVEGNEEAVARALDAAHTEVTNPLTYNDEHCFQSAICLAYFYANTRYTLFKELPTGKGYADLVLIPYLPNIPAMVIELKHNKSAGSALQQIKDKNYCQALNNYKGDLLFVGVNYDEKTKEHSCKIERLEN
ncbi:MAG: AAA family ATPase, partial [Paludibacteraceae bacterium]|nr:AAA family ATPase [Paludibacteraceae bacterium]